MFNLMDAAFIVAQYPSFLRCLVPASVRLEPAGQTYFRIAHATARSVTVHLKTHFRIFILLLVPPGGWWFVRSFNPGEE